MKKILLTLLFSAVPGVHSDLHSEESLYPTGYNISCQYELSDSTVAVSDTFTVTREIVNDETFPLRGLYFSENLPSEFEVVYHSVKVNGADIRYSFSGPFENPIFDTYESYYWIIDDPDSSAGILNSISPGDTVVLEIRITCSIIGEYFLHGRTAVFHGGTTGFFSTGDSVATGVEAAVAVEDDGYIDELGTFDFLTSYAFPNPFNGRIIIRFSGKNIAGRNVNLEIFNILGQKVYGEQLEASENYGLIAWQPDPAVGSGFYFYKLSAGNASHGDKLLLIK